MTIEQDESSLAWAHGIATLPPGRYATVCGLPGTDPRPECRDQPKHVVLKHHGLLLDVPEVMAAYYVWDATARRFARTQAGD